MHDLIEISSRETSKLISISRSMQRYAKAFAMTGNRDFAEVLYGMADAIDESQDCINKAVGAEINRGYKESMKSTGEVLTLVLEKTLRDSEKVV